MTGRIDERVCAVTDDEIVVFLIGMRINRFWKPWKWLPVLSAMPRMLRELASRPELGLLSARLHGGMRNQMVVQYWKSAEHLRAYASASGRSHLPAWRAFNRAIGSGGDVGIWHETYVVPRGHSEAIYLNMPRYGLGLVAPLSPARGARATAAQRLAGRSLRPEREPEHAPDQDTAAAAGAPARSEPIST